MKVRLPNKNPEQQALDIESKRKLVAFLRTNHHRMTMENYLCVTRILTAAGWHHDPGFWSKGEWRLAALEAAVVELDQQVAADKERLLHQTVACYRLEDRAASPPR